MGVCPVLSLALLAAAPAPAASQQQTMAVDTSQPQRMWDGIGGLSAGASSRLLYDYEPSIRDDILDMLFTPKLGWAYQILKIETGGDCQSTWGTESSYAHTPSDIGWDRGYEWWLAKEAKRRNANIALASLSWCVPGWIKGGGLSAADVDYHVNWVRGAKQHHNLTLDYVGVLNEAPFTTDYIVSLRAALDSAGFHTTKLVASDQGGWGIFDAVSKNATVSAAVDVLGVHHMHPFPHPADATGRYSTPSAALALPPTAREPGRIHRPLWSSEDGLPGIDNVQPNWGGAITYASFLFSNLRLKGETATILCPAFNGWRTNIGETLHGFLWAREPHSGHWAVGAGLWVGAHWTHHTERGWWYMGGGSFVPAYRAQVHSNEFPVGRVCETKLLHADSYCEGDHTTSIGTYPGLTEKQCAQQCVDQSQCGFFEWGCTGNHDCILLEACTSVAKSSCENSVYALVNSSQCPLPPVPPPPNHMEQWDLNGSWVVLAPSNGSSTFTLLAETVNAQAPQSVRIMVHHTNMKGAMPRRLNVFVTCLAPSCAGFPSKLHSREASVAVSADGEVAMVLQPAAVYTLTTLSSVELHRPTAPPQRSFFSAMVDGYDRQSPTVLFKSAFRNQQPQEPGFGLANYYGNYSTEVISASGRSFNTHSIRSQETYPPEQATLRFQRKALFAKQACNHRGRGTQDGLMGCHSQCLVLIS